MSAEQIKQIYTVFASGREGTLARREVVELFREAKWASPRVTNLQRQLSQTETIDEAAFACVLQSASGISRDTAVAETEVGRLLLAARWLRRAEQLISPSRSASPSRQQQRPNLSGAEAMDRERELRRVFDKVNEFDFSLNC